MTPDQPARRRRLAAAGMVLLVLLAGALASTASLTAVTRAQTRLATRAMDHHITSTAEVISDEVGHYRDAMADLAAAISTDTTLTAADFGSLTARLNRDRLPGASGVGFVVPAYDGQVAAVQRTWRARGAGGLRLYRTGTDIEHKYVVLTRSFGGVPLTPGRDLSATDQTAGALDAARALGDFTVSSAHLARRELQLPQAQRQVSFTLVMPVFRTSTRFVGWITMSIRGGDFLGTELEAGTTNQVQLELTDPAPDAVRLIVGIGGGTRLGTPRGLERTATLSVGGHTWVLTMWPTTELISAGDRRLARFTVVAGAALTLMLAVLVGVLTGGRNRAMDRVDQATAALRLDITRRQSVEEQLRERERELQELAFHDQLTGLANRILFYDRVTHALQTHARDQAMFAVFFIDLDGFKQVNDELGHSAGDTVLREVAARLTGCLRDSDTVARFGGDEFAVIVERLADPADVHVTAGRIVDAVRQPIDAGRRPVEVTASVGVALNRPGDTADDILREADLAMYEAKSTGKSRHVLAGA